VHNKCEEYDLCLLYGEQLLNEFKENNWNINYKIIGDPRFDTIMDIKQNLFENDRKTILVTPTWGELSLLKKFNNSLIELSKTYNVLVKLHPITAEGVRKDCSRTYVNELIANKSDTLKVLSNLDVIAIMPKVDMLISAYSSTIEEFLYFNKPIIIADPGIKPVENSNPQKVWNVCTVCKNTAKLKEIVDEQFKNDNLGEKRKAYFKNLVYNEKETTAIERGIKAIREVIRK
jgi:CDP-glycerol glycerophosphotransferase (TagB/SpsB family)